MKEIIDNEITKILECCSKEDCENCEKDWSYVSQWDCMHHIMRLSLDLINRQKEEINALNGNTEKYIAECEKRSREIVEDYIKEIKSEAIKDFAERLKERYIYVTPNEIDNLVKEMTESEDT